MIELMTKTQTSTKDDINCSVIIFDCGNPYILEKSSIQYVVDSVSGLKYSILKYDSKITELDNIKKGLDNSQYTLVLYSFNPLLTRDNIQLIIDYISLKNEKFIQLPYGAIFETDYIKDKNLIKEPLTFGGDSSQFLKISTPSEIGYATEVIKRRIIQQMLNNGVDIISPENVVINAFVKIEPKVTIYPFNTLRGDTYIGGGTILKENNNIVDSTIGNNCVVASSNVKESSIGEDCIIFPYNTINKCHIGKSCTIKSHNNLTFSQIGNNVTIDSFNNIGE